ncbi:HU family DNA-binding protein [Paracoccaceae bacterium GXU_MW_L88]
MNKSDLINKIAADAGQSTGAVDAMLKSLATIVSKELGEGGEVTLPGIAKLSTKMRAARTGRNPKTGEPVDIPAKNVVTAKVSKPLADHVA